MAAEKGRGPGPAHGAAVLPSGAVLQGQRAVRTAPRRSLLLIRPQMTGMAVGVDEWKA